MTARLVKFSDAISSMFSRCRFSSATMASKISGSTLRKAAARGGDGIRRLAVGMSEADLPWYRMKCRRARDLPAPASSLCSTNASTVGKAFLIVSAQTL